MRVVVDRLPESPRDCLFSRKADMRDYYVCTLREYIREADEKDTGYKPICICKDCFKCSKLALEVL